MKESGKERLKQAIYESTLSTADAVPLPQWGRQISSGYAAILADGIPVSPAFPSRGRCPEGADRALAA
ncbi:MAG: hypothetical protein EGQ71_01565 [Dialister sp.]|nr:hypothetical protein [Dialister sp.]